MRICFQSCFNFAFKFNLRRCDAELEEAERRHLVARAFGRGLTLFHVSPQTEPFLPLID